ncbi:MAG: toxin-antitoxin system YwqK family antitoxin [Deltaproteobacteria bacterium]|nr:toxin-antitoxin system YwqK family antitoxin [Deltaproteobacteria bacterium]
MNNTTNRSFRFTAVLASLSILVFWTISCSSGSSSQCEIDEDCPYPQVCINNQCIGGNGDGGDGQDGGDDGVDRFDPNCTLNCPVGSQCIKDGDDMWCEDGSGDKQGPYVERDINGNILIEGQYEDGEKEGTWNYYDENGNKVREEHYVDGVVHGPYKTWYPDGSVMIEANYQNGLLHGPYKSWYQNGQVEMEGEYNQGSPCGFWTYYNEDGSIDHTSDNDACP